MLKRLAKAEIHEGLSRHEILGSDYDYLRLATRPLAPTGLPEFRTVDLFAGCGGTALGIEEACRSLGMTCDIPFALDSEASACRVFKDNFPSSNIVQGSVEEYFESTVGTALSPQEKKLRTEVGRVDLLMGGPPCQGHSDLNNYSRRKDAKNSLYFYMARAAEVLQPKYVIIENVQGIMHDSRNVLQRTIESLKSLGYYVSDGLVETVTIGVPQKRRRHIVVASIYPLHKIVRSMFDAVAPIGRDVEWAIGDLRDAVPTSIIDQPSTPSKANLSRIDYLHKHDLFDLPNEQRPPCHRDKVQTYNSVYGRLRWDNPAQTMTSGFYSMCMGRYVHPEKRRTLTAHEAARLQFFPDFFKFESAGTRTAIAKLIGNAVPMKLSYVLLRELFSEHEH